MHWLINCDFDELHNKHIISRKCPNCGDVSNDISVNEMYEAKCPKCGQEMEMLEEVKNEH